MADKNTTPCAKGTEFDGFKKIYCITAEHREGIYRRALDEFRRVGIAGRVQKINGTAVNRKYFDSERLNEADRYKATALSHLQIIREARNEKLENLLVFEDDLSFVNWRAECLVDSFASLSSRPWKLFYLGYNPAGEAFYPKRISDHLFYVSAGYDLRSTHAYSIHRSAYDSILENYDPFSAEENIDLWLSRHFDFYVLSPLMCVQDQTFRGLKKKDWFMKNYDKHKLKNGS